VIAEGIETDTPLSKLKGLNCEGGQGYYFAPPMSFADLRVFLSRVPDLQGSAGRFEDVPTITTVQ